MEFKIAHTFEVAPQALADAMLDENYQQSLSDVGALEERELLSQRRSADGTVKRRVRCVLGIDIPGPARRFLGSSDPAWVEEATWDPESMKWAWVIHPEVAKELLEAKGMIEVEANGEGTVRRVSGDVKVRVPIYGGRVEGFIVEGIRHAYDDEAERLQEWLAP